MAIKLEDKPQVEAPSSAYPFGNIKDNTGSNNGTPVNKLVYADFHQFFAKMMYESGISYNNQPENNTDGFQYWLALVEAIKNNCKIYTDISSSITAASGISIASLVAREYVDGTIFISASLTFTSNIAANTNILSGIPNTAPSAFVGYTSFSSTKTMVGLYAAGTNISNPFATINTLGSPTQFAFSLMYKKI